MIYEDILEKKKLKPKQEKLLDLITKLKKLNRAKINLLNYQIKSFNRISVKIINSNKSQLDNYEVELNKILDKANNR